jgi:hypothetical protein
MFRSFTKRPQMLVILRAVRPQTLNATLTPRRIEVRRRERDPRCVDAVDQCVVRNESWFASE